MHHDRQPASHRAGAKARPCVLSPWSAALCALNSAPALSLPIAAHSCNNETHMQMIRDVICVYPPVRAVPSQPIAVGRSAIIVDVPIDIDIDITSQHRNRNRTHLTRPGSPTINAWKPTSQPRTASRSHMIPNARGPDPKPLLLRASPAPHASRVSLVRSFAVYGEFTELRHRSSRRVAPSRMKAGTE